MLKKAFDVEFFVLLSKHKKLKRKILSILLMLFESKQKFKSYPNNVTQTQKIF
jgi:hypothetical protein